MRNNVKQKIKECNLPSKVAENVLVDVFGRKMESVYQEGLVDSYEHDFECKLNDVVESWRNAETSSSSDIDKFIDWFVANKVKVIRTMLRSVREDCGLGNPPSVFTTNASESINALLKHKTDYKKHQLPAFIEKVKDLIDEQLHEVERAIVGRGKWRFRPQYKFLEISESVWFTMTAQQRQKHLSRVHSISLSEVEGTKDSCIPSVRRDITLSVDADTISRSCNLPIACVEGILNKALELMKKEMQLYQLQVIQKQKWFSVLVERFHIWLLLQSRVATAVTTTVLISNH